MLNRNGLTTLDDTFHERDDDPWWTETVWFAWMVPERKLLGYLYPVFRPNLGVQFGGVTVFDDTGEAPWEMRFYDYDWHQQIPAGLDLRDAKLPGGLSITCLEANTTFRLTYEHRDEIALDLLFEAASDPLVTRGTPPFINGHIDQIGHVTGQVRLHGEHIAVDCFAMRDRSWGPRRDGRQPQAGYAYAAVSADESFLAVSVGRADEDNITTGFYRRNGVQARVTGGSRAVERSAEGKPVGFTIRAHDDMGREFTAHGTTVSRQALMAYPSMLCWNSLVSWTLDGTPCWGEDQDVWHPDRWRAFSAARRAGSSTAGAVAL